jgi:shikimate kinase
VISRLLLEPPHILAAGGGAFIDPDTRAAIKERAISVWLKADLDLLISRVSRKDTRPLLRNKNPRLALGKLLEDREPVYAKADIIVMSDTGPHETVVKRILDALGNYEFGAEK